MTRSMGDREIEHYKEMAENCERTADALPNIEIKEAIQTSLRAAIWPNTLSAGGKSGQKSRAVDPREALRLSIRVRSVRPLFKAAAVMCATNSVCELARKLLAS
jgi:hypothetical protein